MPSWGEETSCIYAMSFSGVSYLKVEGKGRGSKGFLGLPGRFLCFVSCSDACYCRSLPIVSGGFI